MQLAPGGFLIPLGYSHIEKGKHLAFSQIWGGDLNNMADCQEWNESIF